MQSLLSQTHGNAYQLAAATTVSAKDAEIERLKKCLDQAISLANIRLEYRTAHDDPEGDDRPYVCCDSCGTPFLSALAAWLKEKKEND